MDGPLPNMEEIFSMGSRAQIVRADITNYRSIRHATLDLDPFTVLVGPNGAGKSNVVDAFRFVSESLSLGLYTALERRAGIKAVRHHVVKGHPRNVKISLTLKFQNEFQVFYSFRIDSLAGGVYRVGEETCSLMTKEGVEFGLFKLKEGAFSEQPKLVVADFGPEDRLIDAFLTPLAPEPELLALPVIGSMPGLRSVLSALRSLRSYAIVPDRLREPQDPDEGRVLLPDGHNATSVIRSLDSQDRDELLKLLSYAVPGVENVLTRQSGRKRLLEFGQRTPGGRARFEAHQMSDGTLRLFGILLALLQPAESSMLAIEEPETSLHVGALGALVDVLRGHAEERQILLTTHSPDLLNFVDPDELRLVRFDEGHTIVSEPAAHSKKAIREELFELGELHRAGGLHAADEQPVAK
jgi:predicted ATPase